VKKLRPARYAKARLMVFRPGGPLPPCGIARGASLWGAPPYKEPSSPAKGVRTLGNLLSPLRGSLPLSAPHPGLTPWAKFCRPFRGWLRRRIASFSCDLGDILISGSVSLRSSISIQHKWPGKRPVPR
jgi:hypothetical protein